MKAREYLIGQGLAKDGKGKFSNVAKAALNTAIEEGVKFSDYTGEVTAGEPTYETPPMAWPEGHATETKTGTKVSMKSACNGCGYSLYWCECLQPRVLGKEVTISLNG